MTSIIPLGPEEREEARRDIRRRMKAEYKERFAKAGIWGRVVLSLKIEKEVSEELNRRFPPAALYGR